MTAPFTLEGFEPSHRDDYLRLLGDAWGGAAMGGAVFDWWFDGNPSGSLRSVAVEAGEVVGVAGHSFCRLSLGGERTLGQFSVHAVTAPRARGVGIFRALERRHEEQGLARGSSCALAFASASTRPLFLGPLAWTQIDRRRVWARPAPIGRRGSHAAAFEPRHEQTYSSIASRLGNHVVRSQAYLNWRYAESPREYRILEAGGGSFAVVGFTRRRRLRLGLLMELVAPRHEAGVLLRSALAASRGTAALLAVPTPCAPRALLARHGFVPTPYRLDFVGKGLAEPLDVRARAWSVSLGDTDFF